MRITRAEFMNTVADMPYRAGDMPEIALAGKSNVGKSSFINSLCQNSKLARISSEPGKTRNINLYKINSEFVLADLPGYGFAKAPGGERRRWAGLIEGYLSASDALKHVFLLVDIRHAPTSDDVMMTEYLRHYGIPFSVIASKADKLSKSARARSIPAICRSLVVQPWQITPYSATEGIGRDDMLEKLEALLYPAAE